MLEQVYEGDFEEIIYCESPAIVAYLNIEVIIRASKSHMSWDLVLSDGWLKWANSVKAVM